MTTTDTPAPRPTSDPMLEAHLRRMAEMPTEVIIPRRPDTSRNRQRGATRRTRRTAHGRV